jgi:SAM-dependent methyltransferase
MSARDRTLGDYFRLMNANGAARVYHQAIECGILDAIGAGASTAEQIAERCALAPRPVTLLLQVLGALGLVAEDAGRYTLTPLGGALAGGAYRNLGNEYWSHLPALLTTDKPLVAMDSATEGGKHYVAQAAALAWMLAPAAEAAARHFAQTFGGRPLRIIDLGAGSAVWGLTIAAATPGSAVTAVDRAPVLEVAKRTAAAAGMTERLTLLPGDLRDVELPESAFDLAILGNVTHLLTPEGNRGLFRKAARTLAPGGKLAIFDIFPGRPAGDLNRTLYALGLALRTEQGRVYTPGELQELLAAEGYGDFRLTVFDVPPQAVGMLEATPIR